MRALLQRVSYARVVVDGQAVGAIFKLKTGFFQFINAFLK